MSTKERTFAATLGSLASFLFLLGACGGGDSGGGNSHTYTYSGTVVSTSGVPVPNVRVNLDVYGDACPCQVFCDYNVFNHTTTDSAGNFRVSADTSMFDGKCVQYRYNVWSEANSAVCVSDTSRQCFTWSETGLQFGRGLQSVSAIRLSPQSLYRVFGTIAFPSGLVPGTTDPYFRVDCYTTVFGCEGADVVNGKFVVSQLLAGQTYEITFFPQLCATTAPAGAKDCNDKYTFTPPSATVTVGSNDINLSFDAVPK